jgi:uncharacterized protein (TIGR02246 family)
MCRFLFRTIAPAVALWLAIFSIGGPRVARLFAADPKPAGAGDEKSIRATADAFVAAFNHGSAKDLAALWAPNGSLTDERGKLVKGRQAIEQEYAAFFKEFPGAKIDITIKSIEFPTSSVAVEDGIARVIAEDAASAPASRYTAVHVLEGGKWLMASVREIAVDGSERLQDLEWLIGKWQSKSDDVEFESTFHWLANKSFIQRDYLTRQRGQVIASGFQIIGADPQTGRQRSWSFDSSGGFGAGDWWSTPVGWRIQSFGVQADGTPTSATDCLIRDRQENNVLGLRSLDRKVGNVGFPGTPEVVFDRLREQKTKQGK